MVEVKNESLQSFIVAFSTPKGPQDCWLKPGESIMVERSWLSQQVLNLQSRKILRIR